MSRASEHEVIQGGGERQSSIREPREDFTHSLFSCCQDVPATLFSTFLFPLSGGYVFANSGASFFEGCVCITCFPCIWPCVGTKKVKETRNIKTDYLWDTINCFLCPCFELSRQYREATDFPLLPGQTKVIYRHSKIKSCVEGSLIICVRSAERVPVMDINGSVDPYVKFHLKGNEKIEFTSAFRENNFHPVWNCVRDLGTIADMDSDSLVVELFDNDRGKKDDYIGKVEIPLCELSNDVKGFEVESKYKHKDGPCVIKVCNISLSQSMIKRKRLFLIRHGESYWNEAQENVNPVGMLDFDHPLNKTGVAQATMLNENWKEQRFDEEEKVQAFLNAELICSSPLTRALMTAIIGLQDHPYLESGKSLTLKPSLREIKGPGGLDTVGIEKGKAIKERAMESLRKEIEKEVGDYDCTIDDEECNGIWWTSSTEYEKESKIQFRTSDLLHFLHNSEHQNIILVGHSLFFRRLCKKFALKDSYRGEEKFREQLGKSKMDNGACLCLDVGWEGNHFFIYDAEFMFGTGFHGHDKSNIDESSDV